jgi:hypothetical protein
MKLELAVTMPDQLQLVSLPSLQVLVPEAPSLANDAQPPNLPPPDTLPMVNVLPVFCMVVVEAMFSVPLAKPVEASRVKRGSGSLVP